MPPMPPMPPETSTAPDTPVLHFKLPEAREDGDTVRFAPEALGDPSSLIVGLHHHGFYSEDPTKPGARIPCWECPAIITIFPDVTQDVSAWFRRADSFLSLGILRGPGYAKEGEPAFVPICAACCQRIHGATPAEVHARLERASVQDTLDGMEPHREAFMETVSQATPYSMARNAWEQPDPNLRAAAWSAMVLLATRQIPRYAMSPESRDLVVLFAVQATRLVESPGTHGADAAATIRANIDALAHELGLTDETRRAQAAIRWIAETIIAAVENKGSGPPFPASLKPGRKPGRRKKRKE